MSASFYDLLKYAHTGIASPEMTAYDKMRALAMAGGGSIKTLTGVPPLSFRANGKPLISWSMSGNGQQTGTPTPDNPIMPEFVGVRTGNLWNYTIEQGGWLATAGSIPTKTMPYNTGYTSRCRVAEIMPIPSNTMSFTCQSGIKINFIWVDTNGVSMGGSGWHQSGSTVTAPDNAVSLTFILAKVDDSICSPNDFKNIMLTSGSTALDYEPYGYKIPISSASTTTPVYLGEVPTVRRIKKLVLTGEENWETQTSQYRNNTALFTLWQTKIFNIGKMQNRPSVNTHFISAASGVNPQTQNYVCSGCHPANDYSDYYYIRPDFSTIGITSETTRAEAIAAFKAWLAQQHASGTPVTVWYVLAEPETGIINEPLCKIGDYADELHSEDAGVSIPTAKGENTLTVDTDLQPSEMTITYR